MKNEKENSRKQEGFLWIALGLLLIAAALFITAFNLYDELRAEKASSQALNCIEEYLVTEPPVEIPTTATEEPDPLPDNIHKLGIVLVADVVLHGIVIQLAEQALQLLQGGIVLPAGVHHKL